LLPALTLAAKPPDCEANPECAKELARGIKDYQQRQYATARESFEKASALSSDPRLLVLQGRTRYKLGDAAAALELYERARSQLLGAADRAKLEQYITEAKSGPAAGGASPGTPEGPTPGSSPDLSLHPDSGNQKGTAELHDASAGSPAPAQDNKKLKPWVWAVIGVTAAAVVGTAVGLGVYYGTGTPTPDATVHFP
jgi:tetratricopeptide (TPR) repeat protein